MNSAVFAVVLIDYKNCSKFNDELQLICGQIFNQHHPYFFHLSLNSFRMLADFK